MGTTPPKKLIVLGCRGMLGQAMLAVGVERGHLVRGISRPEFDLTDSSALDRLFATVEPGDWLVNAAAYTAVDMAETHEADAQKINADLVAGLADRAAAISARLVQVSTDYVFSGDHSAPYREGDPPSPISAYGRTKLAGERALMAARDAHGFLDWLIVRTAWLFGPHGRNFVATMLDLARTKPELRVVNDQIGSPTYAPDLAEMICRLIEADARGVFHAVNVGFATWFDLAREALSVAGAPTPVHPCGSTEFPRPAARPRNSRLCIDKLRATLDGWQPRPWPDAVRAYLQLPTPSAAAASSSTASG